MSIVYIMSVELLAGKSGGQEKGKGIKRWKNGRRAGAVRMARRVSPLQMVYTDTGFLSVLRKSDIGENW